MNDPNLEDPNNHVPPITAGDDWDDLDESTERSRMGLPPRRVENGLPPKKESLAERVSNNTGKAEWGVDEDVDTPILQPAGIVDRSRKGHEETEPPPEAPSVPGKRLRKARRKPAERVQAEETGELETPPEITPETAVVLPDPKGGKRGRVVEINPGGARASARPDKRAEARPTAAVAKVPLATPGAEPKVASRSRRRMRSGERADWGEKEGSGSRKWMLLAGLGVALLVVLAVVLSQRTGGKQKGSAEESFYSKLALADDEGIPDSGSPGELDQLLNSREQAESIFAAYATAESPDDFIGHVHNAERSRELIQSEWQPLGMKDGWKPGGESAWYVQEGNGIRFAILEGVLKDFTKFRAFFRQDGEKLKMDWKATSGHSSVDFADLKAGKGDASEVRVWLSLVDFYTFSYPEEKFRSFRIMSPKGDMTIWGYAPDGSELERKLLEPFEPGQITGDAKSEAQVILRLQPSDGESLPDQWLIADIIRLSWLDE